jgi:NADPH-dependent 2,4-dienoyl-CoA reductase/sulfur reductase-like enzyme
MIMTRITRRKFGGLLGVSTAAATLGIPYITFSSNPRVIVIGGGAGGATAARYLAMQSNGAIDVTLIEPSRRYYTCFFSNLYLGGFREYESIGHSYGGLASSHGINVVHDWATGVDGSAKTVTLGSGDKLSYDRLVIAPGIDFKFDSIPGYSVEAQNRMPHAYRSGTQAQLLKSQITNMKQGGTFVMVAPPNPYRCPPGPYERVSMVAHQFKKSNPKAKIVVVDPKLKFAKQALFTEGWEQNYPGMIEWNATGLVGEIKNIDPVAMIIETEDEVFKADAACIIPAQKAGAIAMLAGVTDGDWVPIDPSSMRSKADDGIYVLGDATIATAMPKSAFAANSQAKVAVSAILAELIGSPSTAVDYSNTCWSLISPENSVKVGAAYKPGTEGIEVASNFISQTNESPELRKANFNDSVNWYESISADMFG